MAETPTSAPLQSILEELLSESPKELRQRLKEKAARLPEQVLLLEYMAQLPYQRSFSRLFELLKRNFDTQYAQEIDQIADKKEEDLLKSLQQRANDAYAKLLTAAELHEKECKQNAEKARAHLEELKKIVQNESIDQYRHVGRIRRVWRQLQPRLLPSDRKELREAFLSYFKQFDELYDRYRQYLEEDLREKLEKRRQIIEEIRSLLPPKGEGITWDFLRYQQDRLAILRQEWRSIPILRHGEEKQLVEAYREAIKNFLQRYREIRSSLHEKIQKNPIFNETLKAKKALLDKLSPLVERNFENLDEWKKTHLLVTRLMKEWKQLTQKVRSVEDSRYVRQYFSGVEARYNELLDKFFEKSESFSESFKKQQIEVLTRIAKKLIALAEVPENEISKAYRNFQKSSEKWLSRVKRFSQEPSIQNLIRQVEEAEKNLKARRQGHVEKLSANVETRIAILNSLDEALESPHLPSVEEFVAKVIEYERVVPIPVNAADRLDKRLQRSTEKFKVKTGVSEEAFQQALLQARMKGQGAEVIRRQVQQLRDKIRSLDKEIERYQNTLLLLAKGKSAEPLRQEIQTKITQLEKEKSSLEYQIQLIRTHFDAPQTPPSS
ncbi:MAG: DUF349 domain-containing protein [Bacteroidia bacterium]